MPEKQQKATVSVILPTYNRTEYIDNALVSITNQKYPVSEVIVVDDGSAPEIRRKLEDVIGGHSNVQLYHLKCHKGVSFARNFGLSVARGEYVLFLDDDDTVHPLMIESALNILEKNPAIDGVFCQYQFQTLGPYDDLPLALLLNYHRLKSVSFEFKPQETFTQRELASNPIYTLLRSYVAIHSCLLRTSSIGATRFPEELVFGEDKCFWLSLAAKGCKFRMVPDPYAIVGRHRFNNSLYNHKPEKKFQQLYYETLRHKIPFQCRKSNALICLKLVHIRIALGLPLRLHDLLTVLRAPDVVFGEFFHFCKRRIFLRWAFVRYYFKRTKPSSGGDLI